MRKSVINRAKNTDFPLHPVRSESLTMTCYYCFFSVERLNDVNHIERIVRSGDGEGDSEDEFFDCKEVPEDLRSLTKWNSMELVPDQKNDYSGKINLFFVSYSSTTILLSAHTRTFVYPNMPLMIETR